MKKAFYLFVIAITFSACNNNNAENTATTTDNVVTTPTVAADSFCYLHTDGLKNQDTTLLKLMISGNNVTGSLNYMPYEKDRATGTITGHKDGDIITGMWHYMIEGSNDSTAIAFKLDAKGISQKQNAYNPKTGAMYLPDTAQYSIVYVGVECWK